MVGWLPIIKTVVPLVAPIIQAAVPAFTKRGEKAEEVPDSLTAKQIEELQAAVNSNNEFVKTLASALERSAEVNDLALRKMRATNRLCLGISVCAMIVAVLVWV